MWCNACARALPLVPPKERKKKLGRWQVMKAASRAAEDAHGLVLRALALVLVDCERERLRALQPQVDSSRVSMAPLGWLKQLRGHLDKCTSPGKMHVKPVDNKSVRAIAAGVALFFFLSLSLAHTRANMQMALSRTSGDRVPLRSSWRG